MVQAEQTEQMERQAPMELQVVRGLMALVVQMGHRELTVQVEHHQL